MLIRGYKHPLRKSYRTITMIIYTYETQEGKMENVLVRTQSSLMRKRGLILLALSLATVVLWAVLSSLSATRDIWMAINIIFLVLSVYLFGYRYAQFFSSRFPLAVAILMGIGAWVVWMGVYTGIGMLFS